MTKLLTQKELAAMLGTTVGTLNSLRYENKLPIPFVRFGSSIRYKLSDVENWIQSNTVMIGDRLCKTK